MPHVAPRRLRTCAVGLASAAALTGLTAPAALASSGPSASPSTTTVSQGVNPTAIPGAKQTGTTPSATKLNVSFILKAQNLSALESKVSSGWTGPYLTEAQFASQYGQTPQVVSQIEAYLNGYGIKTTAFTDNLDIQAKGTAAQFNRALSIGLNNYSVPAAGNAKAQSIYASSSNPSVPSNLSSDILSILGLSNYAPFVSQAQPATGQPKATGTSPNAIPSGARTPQDFIDQYGLSSLESSGKLGQGETMGVVTLASVNPAVPNKFWDLLGLKTPAHRITLTNIDGGAGPVSLTTGSDETTLDVEQSGAIAPQANIDVYQAPNTDPGFADAFFDAASQDTADSVSCSWGESEAYLEASIAGGTESSTYAQVFDEAFLELDAQGQSNFVATGDYGAYQALPDLTTTGLSTGNPSDSPYTTAAGGTTEPGTQTYPVTNASGQTVAENKVFIPAQLTWGSDYLWPLYASFGMSSEKQVATDPQFDGGSNGGYSTIESQPSYQDGVSGVGSFSDYQYLTGIDPKSFGGLTFPTEFSFNPNPALATGTSNGGRATPDLAFDGDPQTGYALYDPQFKADYNTNILQYGGTSFVAPQLNGVSAVYDSAIGHRVGFWNPTIYAAATSQSSPFTPIDINTKYSGSEYLSSTNAAGQSTTLPGTFSSDNLYYTGTPGTVYNPGSGLGYANLGELETDFASH